MTDLDASVSNRHGGSSLFQARSTPDDHGATDQPAAQKPAWAECPHCRIRYVEGNERRHVATFHARSVDDPAFLAAMLEATIKDDQLRAPAQPTAAAEPASRSDDQADTCCPKCRGDDPWTFRQELGLAKAIHGCGYHTRQPDLVERLRSVQRRTPENPHPPPPRGKRRRYVVKWQRHGMSIRKKTFVKWPAAVRFAAMLEAEKKDPRKRYNVQTKTAMRSTPVDWVDLEAKYETIETYTYEQAIIASMIECGCGCGDWFYPRRSDQRFLNGTHRLRAHRQRASG